MADPLACGQQELQTPQRGFLKTKPFDLSSSLSLSDLRLSLAASLSTQTILSPFFLVSLLWPKAPTFWFGFDWRFMWVLGLEFSVKFWWAFAFEWDLDVYFEFPCVAVSVGMSHVSEQ